MFTPGDDSYGDSLITSFAVAVTLCSFAVAVWSFVLVARDTPPRRPLLIGLAAVELLLLAQLIIAVVLMFLSGPPEELATFVGYLIASILVLPLGTAWALAERSRSSTAVLGVVCVAVPVIVLRLSDVWGLIDA